MESAAAGVRGQSSLHPHGGMGGAGCLRLVVDLLALRAVYRQVGREGGREGGVGGWMVDLLALPLERGREGGREGGEDMCSYFSFTLLLSL